MCVRTHCLQFAWLIVLFPIAVAGELDEFKNSSETADSLFTDTEPAYVTPAAYPLYSLPQDAGLDARWQETSFSMGLDGSKQPQDFGVNALFGGRVHGDIGIPVWEETGLGAHVGLGFNFSANAVTVFEAVGETDHRNQLFLTLGLFQRTQSHVTWAAGYDFQWTDYYSALSLGQFRGSVGYLMNPKNEVGLWGTLRGHTDTADVAGTPVNLQSINQLNMYWRHLWQFGADTMFWIGLSDGHGEEVLVFAPAPDKDSVFVFGAALDIPLSDNWALTGQANFHQPADTGTVDAFLGLTYYVGGAHKSLQRRKFSPVLPVANNPQFAVDLSR